VSKICDFSILAVQGKNEESIQYLQEAFVEGYAGYRRILADPLYDNIRDDERVQKLITDEKERLQKMQDNLALMEASDELKELRKR